MRIGFELLKLVAPILKERFSKLPFKLIDCSKNSSLWRFKLIDSPGTSLKKWKSDKSAQFIERMPILNCVELLIW